MPTDEQELITSQQIAERWGTSQRTVQRLHKSGVLRGVCFGARNLKFRPSAVAEALRLLEECGTSDPKPTL